MDVLTLLTDGTITINDQKLLRDWKNCVGEKAERVCRDSSDIIEVLRNSKRRQNLKLKYMSKNYGCGEREFSRYQNIRYLKQEFVIDGIGAISVRVRSNLSNNHSGVRFRHIDDNCCYCDEQLCPYHETEYFARIQENNFPMFDENFPDDEYVYLPADGRCIFVNHPPEQGRTIFTQTQYNNLVTLFNPIT